VTANDEVEPRDSMSESQSARALASADHMLTVTLTPSQSRGVARVLRHALEQAVDELWERIRPGDVVGHSTRARRIRLVAALDQSVAKESHALWCMLSDAARPHIYEMAPSIDELRALRARTRHSLAELGRLDGISPCSVRTGPATDASCTSNTGTTP